jgi:thiosulfate/3-mercaptopyruvate sulfurtransferase
MIMNNQYANPEVLVSTDYVEKHKNDKDVVIVEVDVDTSSYEQGHIPGAVAWNWKTQLADSLRRDIMSKVSYEKLMSDSGISPQSAVILYGDNNNWFATWAFWQMKIYGHQDVRIMDGGRKKWIAENRELVMEEPSIKTSDYKVDEMDTSIRAFLPEIEEKHLLTDIALVDVRSPDEFTGKILAPPGLPETCQRGGHIPGAQNIPWSQACNEDGTFKSYDALKELYGQKGVTPNKEVISYCRIGERSSHSWFVLKYLLGFDHVKNYDGSWTEWGNLVGVPVER